MLLPLHTTMPKPISEVDHCHSSHRTHTQHPHAKSPHRRWGNAPVSLHQRPHQHTDSSPNKQYLPMPFCHIIWLKTSHQNIHLLRTSCPKSSKNIPISNPCSLLGMTFHINLTPSISNLTGSNVTPKPSQKTPPQAQTDLPNKETQQKSKSSWG